MSVASDDEGILLDDFIAQAGEGADKRAWPMCCPTFQSPTGRSMSEARRAALVAKAAELNIPLIEDNPYGERLTKSHHCPWPHATPKA